MNRRIEELLQEKVTRNIFPFFWLRGEDEVTLRKYMRVIHDAGCHAVCLESRPHPDFCGPRWWHDLDILIEEAKALDMKLWILDDSHFPTGYCNGALRPALETGDYTLLRQSVTYRMLGECREGETLRLSYEAVRLPGEPVPTVADSYFMKPFPFMDDERLLDVVAVPEQGEPVSLNAQPEQDIVWTAGAGRWRVYGLYLTRNRGPHRDYMNMLSLPSCRTLLDAVYEPHWQHYAAEFGKTILGFFSDEPEIGNGHIYQLDKRLHEVEDLPWSDELQAELTKRWGEKWQTRLPLLWDTKADPDRAAETRYQYMDAVTRLVQRDFSQQVGDWCRAHGVQYIGHMIEDHDQHTRCGSSLGHYFRGLRGQDMAGIDDIGGQVLPQGEDLNIRSKWQDHRDGTFYHFELGKLAASDAAISPWKHGNAMCEIFGNYGWAEGVALEKYLAEHFMVRGLNHFVPHAFSAQPFPDKDCPPHFYARGNNPQYQAFGQLVRYMERVCHLISGGTADVRAAVLYHAEADWTGGANQYAGVVGRVLAEHQADYHFLPADVFEERETYCTAIDPERHCLCVNNQCYRVLIVSEASYISAITADALAELEQAGIPVLYIHAKPRGVCAKHGVRAMPAAFSGQAVELDALPTLCNTYGLRQVTCAPETPMLRCLHYRGEDYELYYLANEAAEDYTGTIRLTGVKRTGSLYRYDAWTNRIETVPANADGTLPVTLEPRKGYLYLIDDALDMPQPERPEPMASLLLPHWQRSVCRAIDYPAFGEACMVTLPDTYEREDPDFGGFIRYETELRCDSLPTAPLWLELDGQQEAIEVFVNDKSAGIQIVPGYRFDIAPLLKQGVNTLRVEQATTLERVVRNVRSVSATPIEPKNHVGIDREIVLRGEEADLQMISVKSV